MYCVYSIVTAYVEFSIGIKPIMNNYQTSKLIRHIVTIYTPKIYGVPYFFPTFVYKNI